MFNLSPVLSTLLDKKKSITKTIGEKVFNQVTRLLDKKNTNKKMAHQLITLVIGTTNCNILRIAQSGITDATTIYEKRFLHSSESKDEKLEHVEKKLKRAENETKTETRGNRTAQSRKKKNKKSKNLFPAKIPTRQFY